jgi:hypothetical protein
VSILDSLSIVWLFVGTLVFILLFFEAGFQLGKFMQPRYTKQGDSVSLPMVGSLLTMLAFVLAITFSMVASRFDERKSNVLAEVNAIKTAYTRADLLAEPHGSGVKRILREYVDVRLLAIDRATREDALSRSLELQDRLWSEVNSSVQDNPTRLSTLMVQSVNQINSVHEKRVSYGVLHRIPERVWITLYAIAAFAMMTMGSQVGLSKTRHLIQVVPTALALAALMTLILDLDRPVDLTLTKVSQTSMIDLQKRLHPTATGN